MSDPLHPAKQDEDAHSARPSAYAWATALVAMCTGLNWLLSRWMSITDLAMIYLLGAFVAAIYFHWKVSVVSSLLSLLAFDFFFVPPVLTLRFDKIEHLITGFVLLAVGMLTSMLTTRARRNAKLAGDAAIAAHDEQLRNSLLSSVSHDLRTPLSVIAGSASTLMAHRSSLSDAEQNQLLEAIFEQSRKMSLDVSDVLEMTRLHSGPVTLKREWHPVEELFGSALERCKSVLSRHTVSTNIAADVPMIFVDGVLVEKLLINLLENAAKYAGSGTRIALTSKRVQSSVEVIVEDDGPGLPPGFEETAFKKFSRASHESATPGSGLGLSICKAIADLHQMRIEAGNRVEGGARFKISVPYVAPPASHVEKP